MSLPDLAATVLTLPAHLPFAGSGEQGGDQNVWSDLFAFGVPPVEKVVRTVVIYLGIALVIRLVGKRLMAQMNSLDLVVVLLLSNVVQNAIIGDDTSLSGGLLGAFVLVALNALLDRLGRAWPWLANVLNGRPAVVVRDGEIVEGILDRVGITRHELATALRHQGADSVTEVAKASLEPGGTITVDLKRRDQAASFGDLQDAMADLRAYLDGRLAVRPDDGRHEEPDRR